MLMQTSGTETRFSNGSLFDQPTIRILWPLRNAGFADFEQNFMRRRSAMMDNFMKDFCDAFPYDFLKGAARSPTVGRTQLMNPAGGSSSNGARDGALKAGNKLELALDVREFSIEDITVKLVGRKLVVSALKQEEAGKEATAAGHKEFRQEIELPQQADLAALTCSLSPDGHLKIEAPPLQQPGSDERTVPIRFRTSLNVPIGKNTEKA
ncbi:heat shock protein beta-9 [Amia ocellicauda]|uniref:heat shock protein beta-9 n=1 Tax=Amia ocellicauda TaxID=2972642 RepID=UPI003464730B|nr:HSPBB protein [Amia calva]